MNYKIKVNSESESREAQELFFELGRKWDFGNPEKMHTDKYFILTHGIDLMGYCSTRYFFDSHDSKEITLPELRDIVVLKRNDVGGATDSGNHGSMWYLGDSKYGWRFDLEKWELHDEKNKMINWGELKPIKKESGMSEFIRGREALERVADSQISFGADFHWCGLIDCNVTVNEVVSGRTNSGINLYFRLKPKTILLNGIEIPAPFKPKEGEKFYFVFDDSIDGVHTANWDSERHSGLVLGAWRTEDEIKQVVAALRKVFGGV